MSRAQVEIAHDLDVSVATVQRWIRDRNNQQQRNQLLSDATAIQSPAPDWSHSAEDSSLGRQQREEAYMHFGGQLARFHSIALGKQNEFAERFAEAPEAYLEATLQLAAVTTQAVNDVVKILVMLGSSNDIPTNRLASWSNIPPATIRAWEREGVREVEQRSAQDDDLGNG